MHFTEYCMFFLFKKNYLLFIVGCAVSLVLAAGGLSLVAMSVGSRFSL